MFKTLLNDIKKYVTVYRVRQLRNRAQALADRLGCQVFCVKINGRPTLLTKPAFKELRSKGFLPKSFTAVELKDIALFTVTPDPLHR